MRLVSLFLIALLTLTGLSQGHAQSAKSFPETETPPVLISALLAEHASLSQSRGDTEPASGDDTASCPFGTAMSLSAGYAGSQCAATYPAPDLQVSGPTNLARAPPCFS